MPFWPCRWLLRIRPKNCWFADRQMGTHSPLPPRAGCSMAFSPPWPTPWNYTCPTWKAKPQLPSLPHHTHQGLNWSLGWEACHIQEHCRIMDIFPEHKVWIWYANLLGLPHHFISAFPPKPSQSKIKRLLPLWWQRIACHWHFHGMAFSHLSKYQKLKLIRRNTWCDIMQHDWWNTVCCSTTQYLLFWKQPWNKSLHSEREGEKTITLFSPYLSLFIFLAN